MKSLEHLKQRGVFWFVIIGSALFVVLTVAAMFFYPGGSLQDPSTKGYSFFGNFFSELGFLHTRSGADNIISASLFVPALTLAGFGLMFFFLAYPQFFGKTRTGRFLSLCGSLSGIISGLCFVGVAWAPADISLNLHRDFVLTAFRLFPLAVVFYVAAIFMDKEYPRIYGWVFVVFCMLLATYIILLEVGPSPAGSMEGLFIQVAGQKVIVYASIGSIMIQACGALKVNATLNK